MMASHERGCGRVEAAHLKGAAAALRVAQPQPCVGKWAARHVSYSACPFGSVRLHASQHALGGAVGTRGSDLGTRFRFRSTRFRFRSTRFRFGRTVPIWARGSNLGAPLPACTRQTRHCGGNPSAMIRSRRMMAREEHPHAVFRCMHVCKYACISTKMKPQLKFWARPAQPSRCTR